MRCACVNLASHLRAHFKMMAATCCPTVTTCCPNANVPPSLVSPSLPICSKCDEIYSDPRLLSCLHSFCKDCISGVIKSDGNTSSTIICPVCNKATPLPLEGIEAIPPNLYLEHEASIARYERLIRSELSPPCDECSRDPNAETIAFCCTCVSFLCQECHTQHKISRRATLNHKILLLNDITDVQAKLRQNLTFLPTVCPAHPKWEINLYCIQCKLLVCMQCALTMHSRHNLEDLSNFVKREKEDLTEAIKEMPKTVTELDNLINSGTLVCKNVKAREKSLCDEVRKMFEELHRLLEDRKIKLLEQCSEIATKKLGGLTEQMHDLAHLRDAIVTCTKFVTSLRSTYTESEFLSVFATLHARVGELKNEIKSASPMELTEDDIIHLTADLTGVSKSLSSLGSIFVYKQRDYANLNEPITRIRTTNAYHVAIHKSGDLIVANHIGDAIEIYDSGGNKKISFGSQGCQPGQFQHPLGVAVVGDLLYVVEYNGNRCQKMTINGEFLCEIGAGQLKGAWGCAVSKNGVLYVAEEGNNRVQAFTPDGTSLKVLCTTPSVYGPRDVAIDKQGRIHVAACGSKCIKVFDLSGNFIREYGGKQVLEPSSVAIDELGFCFVGDWGGKSVHIFDPSGKQVHRVQFDGCVSGVAIDENNHVHIVNHTAQTISKY